jgi:hypothetical protein
MAPPGIENLKKRKQEVITTVKTATNPGCPKKMFVAFPSIGSAKKRNPPITRNTKKVKIAKLFARKLATIFGRLWSPHPARNSQARKGRRKNTAFGKMTNINPQQSSEVNKKIGSRAFLPLNKNAKTGTRR